MTVVFCNFLYVSFAREMLLLLDLRLYCYQVHSYTVYSTQWNVSWPNPSQLHKFQCRVNVNVINWRSVNPDTKLNISVVTYKQRPSCLWPVRDAATAHARSRGFVYLSSLACRATCHNLTLAYCFAVLFMMSGTKSIALEDIVARGGFIEVHFNELYVEEMYGETDWVRLASANSNL